VSDKEVAPREGWSSPGPGPQESEVTVDERILAQRAQHSPTDQEQEGSEERRSCFYCLEGWVFLSSLNHDGEEVIDAFRCRRCSGMGRIDH
jgi:hypothetical protein